MAFTVQDDTGTVEDANAYIDVAYFESYCDDRGLDYSAYDSTQKEQAIVRGTAYLDQKFDWSGWKLNGYSQTTEHPRDGVYCYGDKIEGIAREVKKSTAEYAFRSLSDALAPDQADKNGLITKTKKKVDVIEKEITYQEGSQSGYISYPTADNIINSSCLIDDSNQAIRN